MNDNEFSAMRKDEMRIIKKEEIVLRRVGEFFFLVDPKLSYNSEEESLFQTDEVGACIWNCIYDCDTVEIILAKVLQNFTDEKTPEFIGQVRLDLLDFLTVLKDNGFVSEVI